MNNQTIRVQHHHTLHFQAPMEQLFPLFTPLKEQWWAQDWQPQMIYHETPMAEEYGCIFLHQARPDEPYGVWVLSHYHPQSYRVEYVQVVPDLRVVLIAIQGKAISPTSAQLEVSYTLTNLSEAGLGYLNQFDEALFKGHWMPEWEASINAYLAGVANR